MKILFLTDGITPFVVGGMQRHSQHLCAALLSQGVEVELAHCVLGDEHPSAEHVASALSVKATSSHTKCFTFPDVSGIPGHYIRASKQYSTTLFEHYRAQLSTFDIIYAKGFTAYTFIKNRDADTPPIITMLHGLEMFQPPVGIKQWLRFAMLRPLASFCLKESDAVQSYGGKITSLLEKKLQIQPKNIIISSGGIDPSWLRQESELSDRRNSIQYVFVGRNERRKGLVELFEAIKNYNGDAHFHFVGPIPKLNDARCTFHGEISDKSQLLRILDTSDVLLCPSHSEGMPNVIMEGMARGLAVIATDVGATSLLVDEQNGTLLPEARPKQLVRQFESYESASLIKQKRASLNRIANFTFPAIAKEFISKVKSSNLSSSAD